jgi:tight adherence protein B
MLLGTLAFVLVLSVWIAGSLLWARGRRAQIQRLHERLTADAESGPLKVLRIWKDGQEATTTVVERGRRQLRVRGEILLNQAGLNVSPEQLLLLVACVAAAVFVCLFILLHNTLAAMGGSVVVLLVVRAQLKTRIQRRLAVFERQLVEALELAARSLRAGHPLMGAFRLVSEELKPPVGSLFAEICQRQAMGESMESALQRAGSRSGSDDMNLFATSVIIQLRSGGNLADMIQRLAAVIRDRLRLTRRVRVLSAQTQLSKRILVALPVFMFLILDLVNHEYMLPLYTTTTGKLMLAWAGCSTLLGLWIMNRMAVLRY